VTALAIVMWVSLGLIVYCHVGYPLLLWLVAQLRPDPSAHPGRATPESPPTVSLIVAAYAEEAVIEARIANLRALEYPADRLEVIVACDGSPDATPALAPGRRRAGTNQEGLYWRYEMALRRLESRVRSVTGGNGAIYATRRESYLVVDPIMGHDLSFPFQMVKRGWRAVYAPGARASEKMVPTLEGEFARKRRMMGHTWPIVVKGGMLSPRGYDPLYALMIVSHRILRYLSPFLHAILLITSVVLLVTDPGPVYAVIVAAQVVVVLAALAAGFVPVRPLLVARYYVLTTASLAAGLWDWLARGTSPGWEPAEGTR
jgi:cellulose synthase/poly-beta-1,6-N-acetylglucosamine synthase-like glycosyltransferase